MKVAVLLLGFIETQYMYFKLQLLNVVFSSFLCVIALIGDMTELAYKVLVLEARFQVASKSQATSRMLLDITCKRLMKSLRVPTVCCSARAVRRGSFR